MRCQSTMNRACVAAIIVALACAAGGIGVAWAQEAVSAPQVAPAPEAPAPPAPPAPPTGEMGDQQGMAPQELPVRAGIEGPQGGVGPQGFRGPRGGFGPKGFRGPQDGQGPEGFQGPQGGQGPEGFQGPRGGYGPNGFQGPQGGQGPEGFQGHQRGAGPKGLQGPRGGYGPNGFQGPQDGQGPQGFQGPHQNMQCPKGMGPQTMGMNAQANGLRRGPEGQAGRGPGMGQRPPMGPPSFEAIDADGNGAITRDEYTQFHAKAHGPMGPDGQQGPRGPRGEQKRMDMGQPTPPAANQ